jgi:hypothetical protein
MELHHLQERRVVALRHAEEGRHVARPVVAHLDPRPIRPAQEDAAPADDGFGIENMRPPLQRRNTSWAGLAAR